MTISVVIPNYNGKEYLENCLGSLERLQITNFKLEIIIVDNGSADRSVEFIKNNFPRVKVIDLKKNYGFAKAVNVGIQDSKGDYIALLNNDTKVDPNWLVELEKAIRKDSSVNIFASNILSWDGKKIDSQGIEFFWKGKAGQINQGKQSTVNSKQSTVFGASAAAALYKRKIFEKIGFFDEDFGSFLEDVDFAFRANLAGAKTLFVPTATVYHVGGATRKRMGNFKARMDARNWIFLILKNYPAKYLFKYCIQIFLERLRNLSGLLKATKLFLWFPTGILVYGQVLIKLPKILNERLRVQKLRQVFDGYLEEILTAR